ncbi:MAG: O-antigen ligase family protein [Erysipelotrichaceae bacterium]
MNISNFIKKTDYTSFLEKSSNIAFIFVCLFFFDLALTGDGRFLMIGQLSIRMIILLFLFVTSIPLLISEGKELFKNKFILMLVCFGVITLIDSIVGYSNNNDISILKTDIKGFLYFLTLPSLLVVINSKKRIHILLHVIIISGTIQALFTIISALIYFFNSQLYNVIYDIFSYTNGFNFYAPTLVSASIIRQFTFSSIYYITCSILCLFYMFENTELKKKIIYVSFLVLYFFASILTYTRSLYLGIGLSVLLFFIINFRYLLSKKKDVFMCFSIFTISVLLISGIIIKGFSNDFFSYAIERTVGIKFNNSNEKLGNSKDFESVNNSQDLLIEEKTETEVKAETEEIIETPTAEDINKENLEKQINLNKSSDDLRADTVETMLTDIKENLIFGNGLGKAVSNRDNGRTEYFWLDIINKMGLIGFILYLLPFFYAVFTSLISHKKNKRIMLTLIIILTGFFATSYFNPYMGAALGICMYTLGVSVINYLSINNSE